MSKRGAFQLPAAFRDDVELTLEYDACLVDGVRAEI